MAKSVKQKLYTRYSIQGDHTKAIRPTLQELGLRKRLFTNTFIGEGVTVKFTPIYRGVDMFENPRPAKYLTLIDVFAETSERARPVDAKIQQYAEKLPEYSRKSLDETL